MNKSFSTPVLLIAWRRPHTTKQVIDAIRIAAPTKMYVACDGPNFDRPGEVEKIDKTRALIKNEINWHCEVNYLFSDYNQGTRLGVSRAINWFFQNEEEGIILEDDIVPSQAFFQFCSEMLSLYRQDSNVMSISGWSKSKQSANAFLSPHVDTLDYFYSGLGGIWGWATWRKSWEKFNTFPDLSRQSFDSAVSRVGFCSAYSIYQGVLSSLRRSVDTWDYVWVWSIICENGLVVVPVRSLTLNIGFGIDATHTFSSSIEQDEILQIYVQAKKTTISDLGYKYDRAMFTHLSSRFVIRIITRKVLSLCQNLRGNLERSLVSLRWIK
jgi:GR25 family glycosyltransferase involved in LPS biosynthesis